MIRGENMRFRPANFICFVFLKFYEKDNIQPANFICFVFLKFYEKDNIQKQKPWSLRP